MYGPAAKGNMAALVRLARSPWPLPLGALPARRSLLGLANFCSAVAHVLHAPEAARGTFLVADGGALTAGDMIAAMRTGLGRKPGVFALPLPGVRQMLAMMGKRDLGGAPVRGSDGLDVRSAADGLATAADHCPGPCGSRPKLTFSVVWRGKRLQTTAWPIDQKVCSAYVTAMSILPIVTIPDPVLRKISEPIERVDAETLKLMDDMLETMYAAPGIGLAAIQVGVPRRLFVLDTSEEGEPRNPLCLVNPEIVAIGPKTRVYEEGCLSIPDVRVDIERPDTVTVRYVDRAGKQQELAAEGLLATALQHELDHLDGQLIIDFLSRLKRDIIIRKFKKAKRD